MTRRRWLPLIVVLVASASPMVARAGTNMHLVGTTPGKDSAVRSATVTRVVFTYDVDLDAPPLSTLELFEPTGTPVGGSVTLCDIGTGPKRSICFTPNASLRDSGTGKYAARASVRAGPNANSIDSISFAVDDTAPAAPVISRPETDAFVYRVVEFRGTAEPFATIRLSGWNPGATTTVASNGAWVVSVSLPDGTYTATGTATDRAGNTSVPSAPVTFTVDSVAPPAPVIVDPPGGGVVLSKTLVVRGTAEPFSKITLLDNGVPKGVLTLGSTQDWTISYDTVDGAHPLSAFVVDRSNNRGPNSPISNVWVDSRNGVPRVDKPSEGQFLPAPVVVVEGFGRPGWTVKVHENGSLVTSTVVASTGNWTLTTSFAEGPHTISVTATDPSNGTSAAEVRRFTVDTQRPAPPVVITPTSGTIARSSIGVTFSGTSEPFARIAIADQTRFLAATAAGSNGAWQLTLFPANGDFQIRVFATDRAGNSSDPTMLNLTVDGIRPDVFFSTQPNQPLALDGAHVDGTATDERAINKVFVQCVDAINQTRCFDWADVTIAPDGKTLTWSMPVRELLPGKYQIRVQAFDVAGNPSVQKTLDVLKLV